jgi:hypothetical protein
MSLPALDWDHENELIRSKIHVRKSRLYGSMVLEFRMAYAPADAALTSRRWCSSPAAPT